MSANGIDRHEGKIDAGDWTLFDRLMYGGLGYGAFCLPTNFFKIVFSVIYPPLGEILNIVSEFVVKEFPYINWRTLKAIATNLDRIIYSFILTSMFYVPGLIFTLGHITCQNEDTEDDSVQEASVHGSSFTDVGEKGKEEFEEISDSEDEEEEEKEEETIEKEKFQDENEEEGDIEDGEFDE
jgi:uncharacterized membrane protein YqaE (UPF0057 family)